MFSPFVIISVLAAGIFLLQYVTISDIPGSYAVQCTQQYPAVEQSTLYDFLMLPDVANKWMKFVTFVATDHKPIGIGKTYKVAIGSQTFSFVTVEHQQGQCLILQNKDKNDVLNLRVEIRFSTVFCVPVQFEANNVREESLDLFSSYPFSSEKLNMTGENHATNVSQMNIMLNNTLSNVQHEHTAEHQRSDVFSSRKCGSELSFKIFSLYDSLLFQNTFGVMIRYLLSLRLEHSLTNLAHILVHVER